MKNRKFDDDDNYSRRNDSEALEHFHHIKRKYKTEINWLTSHRFNETVDLIYATLEWETEPIGNYRLIVEHPYAGVAGQEQWHCMVLVSDVIEYDYDGFGDTPEEAVKNSVAAIKASLENAVNKLSMIFEDNNSTKRSNGNEDF